MRAFERADEAVKLYESGLSVHQAGERTGASGTTVAKYVSLAGKTRKKRPGPRPNRRRFKRQEAAELYQLGFTTYDLADFYGVSRPAISVALRRLGITRQHHPAMSDVSAHGAVQRAVAAGILKPKPCEVCGENGQASDGRSLVHAHHDDYNKPLKVRWLCVKHHAQWHHLNEPIPRRG